MVDYRAKVLQQFSGMGKHFGFEAWGSLFVRRKSNYELRTASNEDGAIRRRVADDEGTVIKFTSRVIDGATVFACVLTKLSIPALQIGARLALQNWKMSMEETFRN
ncbi:hypothetical protein TWF225_005737 [Orbilia oligospora]|uniref:Uncharacterized protein n=1 Tax=Orbilia oligospora TaxID=2813651 RepID=A0A7C8KP22_ORBOL|nr:hypothetical protein TWF751_005189 [Orbilia oligospora]KAF3184825.1 hypothetical protein TWF225_005737 [Orbilia oligospora]KAF3271340.1 hypothetical protein TWF217_005737 [Orbilia oligospora]KAF3271898.1 hypothetical protein TWF128_000423 [Orbilia oligospora]KAF3293523.1 hypothetical protein TWF132_004492 [Orbilia oligospora]